MTVRLCRRCGSPVTLQRDRRQQITTCTKCGDRQVKLFISKGG